MHFLTKEEEKLASTEETLPYHTIKHHFSFRLSDCTNCTNKLQKKS